MLNYRISRDTEALTLLLGAKWKFKSAAGNSGGVAAPAAADIEARNHDGNTPLHFAARHSQIPTVIDTLVKA